MQQQLVAELPLPLCGAFAFRSQGTFEQGLIVPTNIELSRQTRGIACVERQRQGAAIHGPQKHRSALEPVEAVEREPGQRLDITGRGGGQKRRGAAHRNRRGHVSVEHNFNGVRVQGTIWEIERQLGLELRAGVVLNVGNALQVIAIFLHGQRVALQQVGVRQLLGAGGVF